MHFFLRKVHFLTATLLDWTKVLLDRVAVGSKIWGLNTIHLVGFLGFVAEDGD